MHQSQKDSAPFPGEDEREFWQRAEHRNKATAETYRKLGFAEYEAMEAFDNAKKDKTIGEDDAKRYSGLVEDAMQKARTEIEEATKAKEVEIMKV